MKQYTGNEEFTLRGESSGISLADFWRWAYSDLLNNTSRGVMAEFLVEKSFEGITPPSPEYANANRLDAL